MTTTKRPDWAELIEHLIALPAVAGPLARLKEDWVDPPAAVEGCARALSRVGLGIVGGSAEQALLVIPAMSDAMSRLVEGTAWGNGAYWAVLRTAPHKIVIRGPKPERASIGGISFMVMHLSLAEWRAWRDKNTAAPIAREDLRNIVERIERLEEERKSIADDIKSIIENAQSTGFSAKAIRRVVRWRAMDEEQRRASMETEELTAVYLDALGDRRDDAEQDEGAGGNDDDDPGP